MLKKGNKHVQGVELAPHVSVRVLNVGAWDQPFQHGLRPLLQKNGTAYPVSVAIEKFLAIGKSNGITEAARELLDDYRCIDPESPGYFTQPER